MKRARRTAKCQVGRWRTARACGGTPRRCLCSDRSHTRRHPPQTAPSGPPGPHQDHLGVPAVIFCAISASWLYWAIRTKINCNGLGYQRRRPPNQRMHPPGRTRSAQRAPVGAALKVPIADEDRLVEPDTLGTTIKLTSPASWGSPLAWRRRTTASRGRCFHLYIGSAVVTCTRSAGPGLLVNGPAPTGGAARLAAVAGRRRVRRCGEGTLR